MLRVKREITSSISINLSYVRKKVVTGFVTLVVILYFNGKAHIAIRFDWWAMQQLHIFLLHQGYNFLPQLVLEPND